MNATLFSRNPGCGCRTRTRNPSWGSLWRSDATSSLPGRAAHRRVWCQADSEQPSTSGKARSARERLQANPAYQRLKKGPWKDSYKPTDTDRPPGPVPKHLLEELSATSQVEPRPPGSITQQWQNEQRQSQRQPESRQAQEMQPQASTSGRSEPAPLSQGRVQGAGTQSLPVVSQQQRDVRVTRVRFWLQFHAEFGQRIRLVGSHERLGSWVLAQGAELQWSANDMWNTIVELPAGAIVEYKYVLLENDGARAIAWQRGNNSVLAVGHADDDVEVYDNWEASPGASVVAAGGTSTREGRLLSWATEIESLFASQRSELRKSRMELVATQEEARLAREEARRFRAELRSSEAERVKAEMKVKELGVANRLLRSQLADTTLSFRNALETTHRFLLEAEQAMMSQKDARQAASTESLAGASRPGSAPVAYPADGTAGALEALTGNSDSPAASPASNGVSSDQGSQTGSEVPFSNGTGAAAPRTRSTSLSQAQRGGRAAGSSSSSSRSTATTTLARSQQRAMMSGAAAVRWRASCRPKVSHRREPS